MVLEAVEVVGEVEEKSRRRVSLKRVQLGRPGKVLVTQGVGRVVLAFLRCVAGCSHCVADWECLSIGAPYAVVIASVLATSDQYGRTAGS